MKRHISIFIILIMVFNVMTVNTYGDHVDIDFVDVKIGASRKATDYINLTSDNGFYLYEKSDKGIELLHISDNRIMITTHNGSIDILDLANDIITTIPGDGSIVIGSGDFYNSIVQVEKNKYRDYITFLIKGDTIDIINHVDLEHYLYSVVPKEIPASSPMEALKAQAVVARSFTYSNINKHKIDGYNLCDTTHCQSYGGYDNEHPSTNQSVIETYGEYITYDGVIISALYHSNSGGYTEDSSKVWGGSLPYLVAVEDNFSYNTPNSTWTFKMTVKEAQENLKSANIDVGELLDLKILEISDAGRVLSLKVIGSNGEIVLKGTQLRSIFGATLMKSTWFTIDKDGENTGAQIYAWDGNSRYPTIVDLNSAYIIDGRYDKSVSRSVVSRAISSDRTSTVGETYSTTPSSFVFEGKGYGHGVGMSQYGAMEMANLGYNYYDIITHYYSGVEVTNIGK